MSPPPRMWKMGSSGTVVSPDIWSGYWCHICLSFCFPPPPPPFSLSSSYCTGSAKMKVSYRKCQDGSLRVVLRWCCVVDGSLNSKNWVTMVWLVMWCCVCQDGIQPMWEDEQNKKGGRWLVNMNKNQRHHDLDNVWQEIVSTWSFSCSPVFLTVCCCSVNM